MNLDTLLQFLENHQSLTLVILFFGSYSEAMIITSFLIYGEVFFLAGSILAGMGTVNLFAVVAVLYLGGIAGDHTSYWIGRKWGESLYTRLGKTLFLRRFFTDTNYKRGTTFFQKYGGWSVFAGRFLGPVSWITPFLAGIFRLPYARFTLFNIPAVLLGIGQFILLGYLFGKNYQTVVTLLQGYLLTTIFVLCVIFFLWYIYKRQLRRLKMTVRESTLHYVTHIRNGTKSVYIHTLKIITLLCCVATLLYLTFLSTLFFSNLQKQQQHIPPDLDTTYTNIDELITSINTTTYYPEGTQNVGPINIVIVGTSSPIEHVIELAGWNRTKSIIRDQIHIANYLKEVTNRTLPISDLYFKEVPQNLVFEYGTSSSFSTREHVRLWHYGKLDNKPVYIGYASKDIGFDFYRDRSFIVPFHAVDPNIDASRDLFTSTIHSTSNAEERRYMSPTGPRAPTNNIDEMQYYTDGTIVVLYY